MRTRHLPTLHSGLFVLRQGDSEFATAVDSASVCFVVEESWTRRGQVYKPEMPWEIQIRRRGNKGRDPLY